MFRDGLSGKRAPRGDAGGDGVCEEPLPLHFVVAEDVAEPEPPRELVEVAHVQFAATASVEVLVPRGRERREREREREGGRERERESLRPFPKTLSGGACCSFRLLEREKNR